MENPFNNIFAQVDERSIILFDGICNLCNGAVNFIIRRDRKNHFYFASLQSDTGRELLARYLLPVNDFNSFVLIENGQAFTRSNGALRIFRKLDGLWPILYVFIIVPKFIRDGVYNMIAKKRYVWFGKKDACMLPTPELRARFLN